jgi:hypothetical protein
VRGKHEIHYELVEWNCDANYEHLHVQSYKETDNIKRAALAGDAETKHASRHRCDRLSGEAALKEEMKNP